MTETTMQEIERMVTPRQAAESEGRGSTTIYQRLAGGEYDAVKDGKSTLILWSSVLRRRASLPKATYGLPQRHVRRSVEACGRDMNRRPAPAVMDRAYEQRMKARPTPN